MTCARARSLAVLALLFALLVAPKATAQSGATLVAIVTAEPDASLARRMRAQLQGLGVDVIVLKPPGESSTAREPLELVARNVGAMAAVRVVPSGAGVEVWVADRATGKTVIRELVPKGEGSASDAAVAIGVVELLRASLMELHAGAPSHGDVPVTEKIRALALPAPRLPPAPAPAEPPSPPRLGLSFGAAIELGARGNFGPAASSAFAVWVAIHERIGARAFGSLTMADATITTPEGTVDLRAQWFGAELTCDLTPRESALVPIVGAGAAVAHVSAIGAAVPPLVSESSSTWQAGPLAHAGLGWRFARGLRLRADALAAWTVSPVHVRVVEREAGIWGAPAVLLSAGLEVLWSP